MLEFCGVSKTFNSDLLKKPFEALKNVSFRIPEGQIIGFLGANGAGKTTSIKIAMDFIRPTSGEIVYSKRLGESKNKAFANLGYLPERPFFYPHLTGREFCHYMGMLSDVKSTLLKERVNFWGPRFQIDFALDREIKTYSKGMLQRVGFLATLIHEPSLVILDEPLSGLDPIGRKELKDVIVEINKEGTTVFFSSHIVSDVEEVCHSVVFLKEGEMVFDGSVDKLINDNKKPKSKVKYELDGNVQVENIDDSKKAAFLESLIAKKYEIISIEPEKPSLEEIFYNV